MICFAIKTLHYVIDRCDIVFIILSKSITLELVYNLRIKHINNIKYFIFVLTNI